MKHDAKFEVEIGIFYFKEACKYDSFQTKLELLLISTPNSQWLKKIRIFFLNFVLFLITQITVHYRSSGNVRALFSVVTQGLLLLPSTGTAISQSLTGLPGFSTSGWGKRGENM